MKDTPKNRKKLVEKARSMKRKSLAEELAELKKKKAEVATEKEESKMMTVDEIAQQLYEITIAATSTFLSDLKMAPRFDKQMWGFLYIGYTHALRNYGYDSKTLLAAATRVRNRISREMIEIAKKQEK